MTECALPKVVASYSLKVLIEATHLPQREASSPVSRPVCFQASSPSSPHRVQRIRQGIMIRHGMMNKSYPDTPHNFPSGAANSSLFPAKSLTKNRVGYSAP